MPGCLAAGKSTAEASASREAATDVALPADQRTDVAQPADQQQSANVPSATDGGVTAAIQHGVEVEDLDAARKRRKLPASRSEREEGELSHRRAVTIGTGEVTRLSADPQREDQAQRQDSSRAIDNTRGRKRKLHGEEVVSSKGDVVVGLRSRVR
ncbi:hypothetical protein CBR_g50302 [Chara braunii]|uniref:Uncharacterized protein n=1 Tax=Chara braunii TaxID=69332 RepID=A0A388K5C5_CHABU|nr:hypothetical protein CBR_g50302 [Chara braunii]|eukprot:GBG65260.1 hypothetical protein CBR_g50302 [Chara braunii]